MRTVWLALSGMLLVGTALHAQQQAPPTAPAPPALDPAHNKLDGFLVQWEEKMKGIQSLSAEITRTKQNKVYGTVDVFEGKAKYLKPNLALLDLRRRDKPNIFEKFICTGTYLYEFSPQNQQVRIHELPPPKPGQVADDNFLAFMFGMKAEEAKRRYEIKLSGEDKHYIYLDVAPRFDADKADFQKARIALLRSTLLPRALNFVEANGNVVNYDIPAIETNGRLDRNEFTSPALPPGWKYVRIPRTDDAATAPANGAIQPRVIRPKP
jgi:TIGR03009 family protein